MKLIFSFKKFNVFLFGLFHHGILKVEKAEISWRLATHKELFIILIFELLLYHILRLEHCVKLFGWCWTFCLSFFRV